MPSEPQSPTLSPAFRQSNLIAFSEALYFAKFLLHREIYLVDPRNIYGGSIGIYEGIAAVTFNRVGIFSRLLSCSRALADTSVGVHSLAKYSGKCFQRIKSVALVK